MMKMMKTLMLLFLMPVMLFAADADVFVSFDEWAQNYVAAEVSERGALESEGIVRAEARKEAMLSLIRVSPEKAVNRALDANVRSQLPVAVQQYIERSVRGLANNTSFRPDVPGLAPAHARNVMIRGELFRAYGNRDGQVLFQNTFVEGVAIGSELAVSGLPTEKNAALTKVASVQDRTKTVVETFAFAPSDVELGTTDGFDTLVLKNGLMDEEDLGTPGVPFFVCKVAVARGAQIEKVLISANEIKIASGLNLLPKQPFQKTSDQDQEIGFVSPIATAYASSKKIPLTSGEQSGQLLYARDVVYIPIRLNPLRYVPVSGDLYLSTEMTVTVVYVEPIILEENLLEEKTPAPKTTPSTKSFVPGDAVQYLIITSVDLESSFQVLADRRASHNGFTTGVITVDWVTNNYSTLRPDGGNDTQTSIRNCIRDYVNNKGATYIAFGGGIDDVIGRDFKDENLPSDLYYSGLDGNWDGDGDGTYAEQASGAQQEEADLVPDVRLGRIPVDNPTDAMTYINKLITFEDNPPYEKLNKVMFYGHRVFSDRMGDRRPTLLVDDGHLPYMDPKHPYVADTEKFARQTFMDIIYPYFNPAAVNYLTSSLTSWDKDLVGDYPWPGQYEPECLSSGYQFIWHLAHAGAGGWGAFGVTEAMKMTEITPMFLSGGCHSGAFQYSGIGIGEALLLNPTGGTLSYFACSDSGWGGGFGTGGASCNFMRALLLEVYGNEIMDLGEAFLQHKIKMASVGMRSLQFYINYQGDPAIQLWNPLQVKVSEQAVQISEGGSKTFQVKLSKKPENSVTVSVANTGGDSDIAISSGGSLSFTTSNWNRYQTVSLTAAQDGDALEGTAQISCLLSGAPYTVVVEATEFDDEKNVAPTVSMHAPKGDSIHILEQGSINLEATAEDDARPTTSLSYVWTKVSGPNGVAFSNPNALATSAEFSADGTYLLRLTADDGLLTGFADIQVVVGGTTGYSAPPQNGLIAHYKFDESWFFTAHDSAGNDNPAELFGIAWEPQDGVWDGAMYMDGSVTDYAVIPTAPEIAGPVQNRTVAFWFKADAMDVATQQILYDEQGGWMRTGMSIYLVEGRLYTVVGKAGGETYIHTLFDLVPNRWYHVAMTLDASDTNALEQATHAYLNGVEFGVDAGAEFNHASNPLGIGMFQGGDLRHHQTDSDPVPAFKGLMDEFVLYDRTLSASEISTLCNLTFGVANAGADQSVDQFVVLDGAIDANGQNLAAVSEVVWEKVSGPGSVNFSDSSELDTSACFNAPGTYILRLTISNGTYASSDEVTVQVANSTTLPVCLFHSPIEGASFDGNSAIPVSAFGFSAEEIVSMTCYAGTTVIGQSENGVLVFDWSVLASGSYDLHAESEDINGIVTQSATITMSVSSTLFNEAPVFSMSYPSSCWARVVTGNDLVVTAQASDDGNPNNSFSTSWSLADGAAGVVFSPQNTASTTISFPSAGQYVLNCTLDDGAKQTSTYLYIDVSDDLTITKKALVNSIYLTSFKTDLMAWKEQCLSYEIQSDPAWAEVTDEGLLKMYPGAGELGSQSFIIRVTNEDNGGWIDCPVTVNVQDHGLILKYYAGAKTSPLSKFYSPNVNLSSMKIVDDFATPVNIGNNYGIQVKAILKPEVSGDYHFWIAADDRAELWLSTSENSLDAQKIAGLTSYSNVEQWDKYASQKSALISLVAGEKYYIATYFGEGGGGDHMEVAWEGPGFSREVIPQRVLLPMGYALNYPADIALKGWWKFDESPGKGAAADSSGNGLYAANSGGVVTGGSGKNNNAFYFDGVNGCSTTAKSMVPDSGELTICAWINPSNLDSNHAILSKKYMFSFQTLEKKLRLMYFPYSSIVSSEILTQNEWQFVAITFASSTTGGCKFYRNGIYIESKDTGNINQNSDILTLAKSQYDQYFEGGLDDVRLYDRVLTDVELQELYQNGDYPPAGDLIVRYAFDEVSGTTVEDLAGGDHPGSLSGGTWNPAGGIREGALALDGVDDGILIVNESGIQNMDVINRTISLWFRADALIGQGKQMLFEEGGTGNGLNLYLDERTLWVGAWGSETHFINTTGLNAGQWYHVTLVLDESAGQLRGYLDGVEFASVASPSIPNHGNAIGLGRVQGTTKCNDSYSGSLYFGGDIDEFLLYNRALSLEEIVELAYLNKAPTLANAAFSVAENSAMASVIGTLSATDPNAGEVLTYTLTAGNEDGMFAIAAATGELTVAGSIDYEITTSYSLTVTVTDSGLLTDTATLSITITDVPNDDSDADGLIDEWEVIHFGSVVAQDGSGDPDGDGASNRQEQTFGTDPMDANDAPSAEYINLHAWWKLDETSGTIAADSSGNGWDASNTNGVSINQSGKIDGAFGFDGIDDFSETQPAATAGSNITITAWIHPSDLSGSQTILSKNNSIVFKLNGSALRFTTPGHRDHGGLNNLTADEWQFVAVTFVPNTTAGCRFYRNGTISHSTDSFGMTLNGNSFILGNNQWNQRFSGRLDDVRLYNRVLTDTEVADLYNQNAPPRVYLSDINWVSQTTGWGTIHKDRSINNRAITLDGTTYPKGLGTHAQSEIVYNLAGNYVMFHSVVGVDDETGSSGSVTFKVFGDDVLLYETAVITAVGTETLRIDVTDVQTLKLVADDGGDGIGNDHADWADAYIVLKSAGIYTQWKYYKFTSVELADPVISGDAADVDADQLSTLIEYALGLDPKVHSGSLAGCAIELDGSNGWKVEFNRHASRNDIDLVLEWSDELNPANWQPVAQSIAGGTVQPLNGATLVSETGSEPTMVELNVPSTVPHGFIRWKVERR